MTTFLVPAMKLTKPMTESDLLIAGITCSLIYKGGFAHAFYALKRKRSSSL